MKKLILASGSPFAREKLRPAFLKALGKAPSELKILHITTAAEVVEDNWYSKKDTEIIRELGFSVDEFDITGKTKTEILSALKGKDIVYVQGGNGYWLLKQSRESGFGEIITELVKKEDIIYVGKSAGTFLACPTVEVQGWSDTPWRKFGLVNLDALGLVPFLVKAHYTSDQRINVEGMIKTTKYPVRVLTDTQAFTVQDDIVTLIGEGKEVLFDTRS